MDKIVTALVLAHLSMRNAETAGIPTMYVSAFNLFNTLLLTYFQIGGPAWGASLHNKEFVDKMLEHVKQNESSYGTQQRMKGMLTVIGEEVDSPLYWTLQRLCGTLHCTSIPLVDL